MSQKQIGIYAEPEVHDALEALAKDQCRTLSGMMRFLIMDAYKKLQDKESTR